MNPNKRCIVNFASIGRENYLQGSQRLVDSVLNVKIDADILICSPDFESQTGDFPITDKTLLMLRKRLPSSLIFGTCPPHSDAPYAFKSYVIQEAIDMGYEEIMWADSSCVFLKNPEMYFKLVNEIGIVTLDNPGCLEATWTADDCLEHIGCDKEFGKTFFQIDAFMMIFDFKRLIANQLFEEYFKHSRDGICLKGEKGSDRPDYKAHRHDQSILSFFIKTKNIHPINYGAWCYWHEFVNKTFNPTFCKVGVSQIPNFGYVQSILNGEKN